MDTAVPLSPNDESKPNRIQREARGAFAKGRSANPYGRPRGSRNLSAQLRHRFATEHGPGLLLLALQHAANDSQVCMWLVGCIFGRPGGAWINDDTPDGGDEGE